MNAFYGICEMDGEDLILNEDGSGFICPMAGRISTTITCADTWRFIEIQDVRSIAVAAQAAIAEINGAVNRLSHVVTSFPRSF